MHEGIMCKCNQKNLLLYQPEYDDKQYEYHGKN